MLILIADSTPGVRSALRLYIEQCRSDADFLEAGSFSEVRSMADHNAIDVALIDWHLPDLGGKATLQYLRSTQPDACVIVLSGRPEAEREASDADADAFISKGDPPDSLKAILAQRESCSKGKSSRSHGALRPTGGRAQSSRPLRAPLRSCVI